MTASASNAARPQDTQPAPYHKVWDGFDSGFSAGAPGSKWNYFEYGPFVGNDGVATTSAEGLRVAPQAKNPRTGQPAFALSLPPEQDAKGVPGQFDHVKWLAYCAHQASTGLPGFDAVRGQQLAFETWFSVRTFGTQGHPFGAAVEDAEDDLRLAMGGQNAIDVETGFVFDMLCTNKRIYALYERLTFARTPQRHYAAFTYAIPVAERTPDTLHHSKIAYDRAAGVVSWLLDEKEVFRVDRVGRRIDSRWALLDHGGQEEDVELRQLNCGMGLFTLLDGARAGRNLVRLSGAPGYYQPVPGGAPVAPSFLDEQSQPGSRLFGQGAELRMLRYQVSSTPITP